MPRIRAKRTPSYRHPKSKSLAFVEFDRHRIYLGRHDSPKSQTRYTPSIAEWAANGQRLPLTPDENSIVVLAARYMQHCREYFRHRDGSRTKDLVSIVDLTT